ncbi:hypothetical protein CXB51_001230 [Gossypium anomalum]|uniref:Reverse transcriptase zinc-binding domain-containing protein n=1 Tax=Gossypium anomalum TaxID=47600 RepID=A0A8J5ZJB3_9ROSI|nr:hypothetical protein CXB51_001230 [Gossypium anomalum]
MGWNFDLIDFVFASKEVDLINSIPLLNFHQADHIVWGVSTLVFIVFRVVIAYCLALLLCPPKIKIALWKFLKQFVPTKVCLYNKRIVNDVQCPRCYTITEEVSHVLRHCAFIRTIRVSILYDFPRNNKQLSFTNRLSWMFAHYPVCRRKKIAVVLWGLWYSRNKLLHEGIVQRVSEVVTFVRGFCFEITEVAKGMNQSPQSQIVCWFPPSQSFVKVNVDASFSFSLRKSYSRVSIRDEQGQIMGACSRVTFQVPTVFAVEAIAIVYELRFAFEMGFWSLILESDAQAVIYKLNATTEDLSEIRNRAMHAVAQEGMSRQEDGVLVEEVLVLATSISNEDRRLIDPPYSQVCFLG